MVKNEGKKIVKKTMQSSLSKSSTTQKSGTGASSLKKLSTDELNNLIAKKAYEFYLERGAGHGNDHSDWFKAECYVRSKYKM